MEQGLETLNGLSGRNDTEVIFVLSDRLLELGDDPHLHATMRSLPEVEPEAALAPSF